MREELKKRARDVTLLLAPRTYSDELEEGLKLALTPSLSRCSIIHGPRGIGKTCEVSRRVIEGVIEGKDIVYVNFDSQGLLELVRVLEVYHPNETPPSDETEQFKALARLTDLLHNSTQKELILLVVDGVDRLEETELKYLLSSVTSLCDDEKLSFTAITSTVEGLDAVKAGFGKRDYHMVHFDEEMSKKEVEEMKSLRTRFTEDGIEEN